MYGGFFQHHVRVEEVCPRMACSALVVVPGRGRTGTPGARNPRGASAARRTWLLRHIDAGTVRADRASPADVTDLLSKSHAACRHIDRRKSISSPAVVVQCRRSGYPRGSRGSAAARRHRCLPLQFDLSLSIAYSQVSHMPYPSSVKGRNTPRNQTVSARCNHRPSPAVTSHRNAPPLAAPLSVLTSSWWLRLAPAWHPVGGIPPHP